MKQQKLVMNVSQTRYPVVRYVGKKLFQMRLSHVGASHENEDPKNEWDILWTDSAVQCERLYRMKPFQRINHFPGMYELARKNKLARNLCRMQRVFPEDYNFFPTTWNLPADLAEFRKQFTQTKAKKN